MMALHKLSSVFKKNPISAASARSANASSAIRIKDRNQVALPETSYASEVEVKESGEGVKVFITGDRNLLNQYYKLRNDIFQNERGWTGHEWFENDFDRNAGIVIVVNNENRVIGGARVMISLNGGYLSDEIPGTEFVYSNLFKKMNLDPSKIYGEIDGLVVAAPYRNRNVTEKILKASVEYSLSFNCSYLVGIAFLTYCRIYRSAYKAIGYPNAHIVNDFVWAELEEYNYSKDFPIVNIIKP